eukprot:COSAG05_NODE_1240_length_5422_cov_6.791283_2_plen_137_part_00
MILTPETPHTRYCLSDLRAIRHLEMKDLLCSYRMHAWSSSAQPCMMSSQKLVVFTCIMHGRTTTLLGHHTECAAASAAAAAAAVDTDPGHRALPPSTQKEEKRKRVLNSFEYTHDAEKARYIKGKQGRVGSSSASQ